MIVQFDSETCTGVHCDMAVRSARWRNSGQIHFLSQAVRSANLAVQRLARRHDERADLFRQHPACAAELVRVHRDDVVGSQQSHDDVPAARHSSDKVLVPCHFIIGRWDLPLALPHLQQASRMPLALQLRRRRIMRARGVAHVHAVFCL
jgi:hypothetical protein